MSELTMQQERSSRMLTKEERKVILASSAGTIFEWYDFYLYGSLAAIIGAQFFSSFPEATRNVFALLAFAAGFLVRPFGALVFGRLGDLIGRKYTFLMTILIMGIPRPSWSACCPATRPWGRGPDHPDRAAHAAGPGAGRRIWRCGRLRRRTCPAQPRGYFTSWIQTTATLGLLLSLLVILVVRTYTGEKDFAAWGWRIPFLLSIFLLAISLYIRSRWKRARPSRR
jgi:MFS family permease